MKQFKILSVALFSLMLVSGCSNSLPQDKIPTGNSPLSGNTSASDYASGSSTAKPSSNPVGAGHTTVPESTVLPGTVDNPDQRNQKLAPNPAPSSSLPPAGTGGSGQIIDGIRDSVGAGNSDDKRKAAESYISFVNLMNAKDYAGACAYVKLTASQGTDCLGAMEKLNVKTRTYPDRLKIDRLDNAVVEGDTALLNRLVFVYDGDKRIRDVTMYRPTDGSGKWKTNL